MNYYNNDLTANNTRFQFSYSGNKYGYKNASNNFVPFENSSDATATADKILSGFTAYSKGQKLTGTASSGPDISNYSTGAFAMLSLIHDPDKTTLGYTYSNNGWMMDDYGKYYAYIGVRYKAVGNVDGFDMSGINRVTLQIAFYNAASINNYNFNFYDYITGTNTPLVLKSGSSNLSYKELTIYYNGEKITNFGEFSTTSPMSRNMYLCLKVKSMQMNDGTLWY